MMIEAFYQQKSQIILMSVDYFDPFEFLYLVLSLVSFPSFLNFLSLQIKHHILLAIADGQVSLPRRYTFNEIFGIKLRTLRVKFQHLLTIVKHLSILTLLYLIQLYLLRIGAYCHQVSH